MAISASSPSPAELAEAQQIDSAFQRLMDSYVASNHRQQTDIIRRAFTFARAAHEGIRRKSGEPYILHPLAVAQIVSEEMGLGSTSICAALLHDVIEDTAYTRADLENLFGAKIANIVEGVTKVRSGVLPDRASIQAETFKKILLTMSEDIRVMFVKIADRLHNMRTLAAMSPSRQHKIVGETLAIFAPIADRLGLGLIKAELEELSFRYEHPQAYAQLQQQIHAQAADRIAAFERFAAPISAALEALGIVAEVLPRWKQPYSIWRHMQRRGICFEEVYDLLSVRIVFRPQQREQEVAEAYAIYAALTQIYKAHPAHFRDWLTTPKANGYQALHNRFMSPSGQWIAVQICSDRMNEVANWGFTALWKYRDRAAPHDESDLEQWVKSIQEILDDPHPNTLDLINTIQLNLSENELQVFTPKGEIIALPQGATVLDFAFSIHTLVGMHCMGAKVNHRLVALSHRLQQGDQVEILTSPKVTVSAAWERWVITGKARGKIAAQLRRERKALAQQGEQLLRDFLEAADVVFSPAVVNKLRVFSHFATDEAYYLALAEGHLTLGNAELQHLRGKQPKSAWAWRRFVPFLKTTTATPLHSSASAESVAPLAQGFVQQLNPKATLSLTPEVIAQAQLCPSCQPLCGDEVLGYITSDAQLEIHRRDCPTAQAHKTSFGNQVIAAEWTDAASSLRYAIALELEGVDSVGLLWSVAKVLADAPFATLSGIQLDAQAGVFRGELRLQLASLAQLDALIERLLAIPEVQRVVRRS